MGITDLVWTPANHIALLKLNPQFQAVFRWAIVWIKGQILGYDGYPDLPACFGGGGVPGLEMGRGGWCLCGQIGDGEDRHAVF